MLSVTVIGGYLGAGKTTLVNHLLRHAGGTRIAVLVNEFGALPIDEDLIEAQDDTLISIAGGCVCCSYGNDLIEAMLELARLDPTPDHVLIEASGIAMPGAIAASVSVLDGYQMDGIVVLADAETIMEQAANDYVGDTIARQLSDAGLVLLNKADLVSEGHLVAVVDWLGEMAPEAGVIPARQARVPKEVIMQQFPSPDGNGAWVTPHSDAPFESKVVDVPGVHHAAEIAERLADPALQLVRAKGFVRTALGMQAVQVVGRRWSVSQAPEGAKAGLVVISQKSSNALSGIDERIFATTR